MAVGAVVAIAASFFIKRGNGDPIKITDIGLMGLAGKGGGRLPDLLEPATSPNHRQFFHSFTTLSLTGAALYKTYKWEPEDEFGEILRLIAIAGLGAYISHLVLDSSTPKGLPIVGKL
jgi:membrane-bound metal-dependent hydrolase YbcI (DUF457 family)